MHKITVSMLGVSGVGKTSLLASMDREFWQTIGTTKLQLRPDKETAPILTDAQRMLEELANSFDFVDYHMPTEAERHFGFDIGKTGGSPTLHIDFVDYPGGWVSAGDKKVYDLLKESAAILIPIDAPALMEERGRWNTRYNNTQLIAAMFEHAYEKLDQPRMVIFAPVKCEKYVQDPKLARELQKTIKDSYQRLLKLFQAEPLDQNVVALIAPVQTMGNIYFSRIEVDKQTGDPHFRFRKRNPDDSYNPRDGDQPLRYLLRFLLRLHYDQRAQSWGIFRFLHDWFRDKYLKKAVTTFSQGCKLSNDGFEIIQGPDWLKI